MSRSGAINSRDANSTQLASRLLQKYVIYLFLISYFYFFILLYIILILLYFYLFNLILVNEIPEVGELMYVSFPSDNMIIRQHNWYDDI